MNKNKKLIAGMIAVSIVTANVSMTAAAATTSGGKEEVVYVMTDAQGNVDSVNVVNIFGKGSVTDYGDYSSVKMLTSTDAISQDGDKITFTTDQEKVYYQGTLDNAQIPWNIKITYYLDGKEISPEDLAGQSGALKIHTEITQNKKCKPDFYDNYALQAAFTLSTKQCENIVAEDATLTNVGEDKQISYTILPGKGLEADITADVTDFEMDAVTINGIKLNLNVEIDDAELMDKVTEIMDASADLNSGAKKVQDGAGDLTSGSSSLNDGANTLYEGVGTLDDGISSLSEGISTVRQGLDTLNSKSSSLTDGSGQVYEALKKIQSGLSGVSVSTEDLKKLTESSGQIKKAIGDLAEGSTTLQKNLSYEAYKAAMKENGLDLDEVSAGNAQTISALSEQVKTMEGALEQLKSIPGYEDIPEYAEKAKELEAQIDSFNSIITLLTGNSAAIGGMETYLNTISSGMESLAGGASELKTQYETFDEAINTLSGTLTGLAGNMTTLKGGIDELVKNYESLDSGIKEYTEGVATIVAGYQNLVDGVSALSSGSKDLLSGAESLKQGTSDLHDGAVTLADGTNELSDGTAEFYDKTSDMDTQVQDQIDEMIASISGDETGTVSFVSEKNTNVDSVQFVIKTAAVEKEEVEQAEETETQPTGFWQKLLQLFGAGK